MKISKKFYEKIYRVLESNEDENEIESTQAKLRNKLGPFWNLSEMISVGPFCAGDPIINLVGNPAGGVFSGVGVVGNTFNPGAGSQTVTYTYNDPNGCSGVATFNIVVSPTPNTSPIYKE